MKWGLFRAGKGFCAAAWSPKGLVALVLTQPNRKLVVQKLHEYLPAQFHQFLATPPTEVPSEIQIQTRRGLTGKTFRFKEIDISFLTPFQQRVLRATCLIPWGEVRSYGWVARKAGSPRGFRAAGQALNKNTIPLFIPCHRVIASGSRLGGYGGGIDWKIRLLKNEGLSVKPGPENDYRVEKL